MSLRRTLKSLLASVVAAGSVVVATPMATEAATGTLVSSANGRYVQWSDGTPVFLLSDTAWLMPGRYPLSEVNSHATTRASQGFTAIQMTAAFPEVQNGAALQNINDIFTSGDMARPIDSYFDQVEAKVNAVTSKGLIVILNPFWKKTMDTYLDGQGEAKNRSYARYLASRFVNNPSVAYFIGGDAIPGVVRPELNAQGLGILDAYAAAGKPNPIVAYHSKPGESSREAWPSGATWLNLDWTYDYSPPLAGDEGTGGFPYVENRQDWQRSPTQPIMFGEGWYDRDNGATTGSRWGDRHMLRRQAWWSAVSGGIGGYAYGAEPIWTYGTYNRIPAATALNWNSGLDAARMANFLRTTQWTRLQPDISQTFLTGGFGTYRTTSYAVASVADDKSFAVVYTPVARTLNLRMPPSGRTYTLRWFDPSNGTYRTGSTTAASGAAINMTTPGNNASGKADWVIHVTSGIQEITVPTEPRSVTASAGNASATVSWSPPLSDGGSPVTRYDVAGTPGGTCSTTGATSCTVTGLTNGTSYTFTVRASNVRGQGPPSASSNAVTPSDSPQPAFSTFTSVSSGMRLAVASGTNNVVQSTSSTSTLQQWEVRPNGSYVNLVNRSTGQCAMVSGSLLSNSAVIVQAACSTATSQQWTLNGSRQIVNRNSGKCIDVPGRSTTNGTQLIQYTCSTSGATNQQWTRAAADGGVVTAPGAPTGVSATAGNASATVRWTAPSSNGGATITRYTVTGTPGGSCTTTGATSCTVTGLTNGTAYTFRVTATNSAGTSPQSSASNAVTPTASIAYSTFTSVSSGMRLAVASGTNNVVQSTSSTSTLQHWEVRAVGSYVNLVNRSTGQCAMVSGSSLTNSAAIVQAACNTATTSQQWTLNTTTRQIVNRNSGKCLDVPGRSTTAGIQMIQYTCSTTGATNQQWTRATA